MSTPTPPPPESPQPGTPPPFEPPAAPGGHSAAPGEPPAAPGYAPPVPGTPPVAGQPYPPGPPLPGYPVVVQRRTNPMAIAALASPIVGLLICPLVGGILGVVFGRRAQQEIAATGDQGEGLAAAGIVIGWIAVGFGVLQVLFYVAVFGYIAYVATVTGGMLLPPP